MTENFVFSGHDTVALAQKYGTPLYVMSEDILRANINRIKDAFESAGAVYDVNYAGKTFLNMGMCRIIESEGISLDVASGGELYTAVKSGFNPARICFHGSNKNQAELEMALGYKVGRIVIDSEWELERLQLLTEELEQPVKVLFRVSPGIEAHTHELIQTGKLDSKFGLPLSQAREIIGRTKEMNYVETVGIHCHIGSQIADEKPFLLASEVMLDLYKALLSDGLNLTEINLGGGFGIPYLKEDPSFDVTSYIPKMVDHMREMAEQREVPMPKIVVEPGRSVAAPAGITLYTVGTVKEILGLKKYVSVDGGMADNPRPALYGADYDAVICNKPQDEALMEEVTVSGKACETDTLIKSIKLPSPQPGDTLAVLHTGAYNYSMASNYNRFRRPAVILLKGDQSAVLVERESFEDLIKNDRIPSWLED
ncbi:diaminopimelate decarboxylase [Eubacterium callanderi]|uniref:diaminopimelate decarboxylase n=1 Tax=Eubacterium callanderi TaxID=53442 RepID=UPI001AA192C2|nr:diaminopimelate decarboxylase [Eubacterium callanderi]MBO1700972.1 diaminopimelate decarboxylase [Eubacterium callanderi]MDR4075895.1 diaminopimelate decarboxylase [Eubacterium sp.]